MEINQPEIPIDVNSKDLEESESLECQKLASDDQDYQEDQNQHSSKNHILIGKRKLPNPEEEQQQSNLDLAQDQGQLLTMARLPKDKNQLMQLLRNVELKIGFYKNQFVNEQKKVQQKSYVKDESVPICGDVTKIDFDKLAQTQLELGGRPFDVIMMDPPWKLSTSQPSRGVAIQYDSLGDQAISQIPVQKLQTDGFLLVWVINAKFQFTVNLMQKKWGYKIVDSINWIKKTVNGKIAKGHGFYLQHAKETCIVGVKGNAIFKENVACDIIFSERRGQSQKPTEIYEYVQQLVPNGFYLQIFGRRNNLRNRWVTIGNQL